MAEIKCEITERFGVFSRNEKNKKTKEVNLVSWNERDPKIDIREWDTENGKAGKGITMTHDEASALLEILSQMKFREQI